MLATDLISPRDSRGQATLMPGKVLSRWIQPDTLPGTIMRAESSQSTNDLFAERPMTSNLPPGRSNSAICASAASSGRCCKHATQVIVSKPAKGRLFAAMKSPQMTVPLPATLSAAARAATGSSSTPTTRSHTPASSSRSSPSPQPTSRADPPLSVASATSS